MNAPAPSRLSALIAALVLSCSLSVLPAAGAGQSFTLRIKDHRFSPETLKVPANQEFDLTVINADPTAEEFESNDFHVEKVIAGRKQMTFHIGPLTAGTYGFFGERHMDTALGNLFAE
jgi:hypothetical protein